MVGRAPAVLSGRRRAALGALLAALVAWDALAAELPALSNRLDLALVALVLLPAGFAAAWLLLPFALAAIVAINLGAALLGVFWPRWPALSVGYQLLARKP